LIVDISVPRDVEAAVGDLPNVFLYSIDDLEQIVTANCARRQEEVPAAERIVDRAVDDFWRWRAGLRAVPIIKELRERAERVRQAELDRAIAQFSDLSPQDRERIDRLTRSMLHKLLHEPTTRLRKAAENGSDLDILAALRFLLGPGEHGEE
jgi:glutamyl-tRNA reductase